MEKVLNFLLAHQDNNYRDFTARLVPHEKKLFFLGVRIPLLRQYAKAFAHEPEAEAFMNELPHRYYEEYAIHRFLIEGIRDYSTVIYRLKLWLPYVTNWANCDGFRNSSINKHKKEFLNEIKEWLTSDLLYTKRFAIMMLMSYYLDDDFDISHLALVSSSDKEDTYYLQMMVAWYLATALAKHYEQTKLFLLTAPLTHFTFHKTIQKARESYRLSSLQKEELKQLKK